MPSIYKRKNKNGTFSWRAVVRIKGHPSVCSHWDRKQEAEDWAHDIERRIKAGQFDFGQHNKIHTFNDLLERYKHDGALQHHKSADDTLRHLDYWESRFSNFSLKHLTPELLGKERQLLLDTPTVKGAKRAPSTVNRYMASLSAVLSYATKQLAWINENPVLRLIRPLSKFIALAPGCKFLRLD